MKTHKNRNMTMLSLAVVVGFNCLVPGATAQTSQQLSGNFNLPCLLGVSGLTAAPVNSGPINTPGDGGYGMPTARPILPPPSGANNSPDR